MRIATRVANEYPVLENSYLLIYFFIQINSNLGNPQPPRHWNTSIFLFLHTMKRAPHKTHFCKLYRVGLCKKFGARLREKFSPATASPGQPCQAGAYQNGHFYLHNAVFPLNNRPHAAFAFFCIHWKWQWTNQGRIRAARNLNGQIFAHFRTYSNIRISEYSNIRIFEYSLATLVATKSYLTSTESLTSWKVTGTFEISMHSVALSYMHREAS